MISHVVISIMTLSLLSHRPNTLVLGLRLLALTGVLAVTWAQMISHAHVTTIKCTLFAEYLNHIQIQ